MLFIDKQIAFLFFIPPQIFHSFVLASVRLGQLLLFCLTFFSFLNLIFEILNLIIFLMNLIFYFLHFHLNFPVFIRKHSHNIVILFPLLFKVFVMIFCKILFLFEKLLL